MRRVGRSFTSSPANDIGWNYRRAIAMVFQSGARTACPSQMTRRRKQSPIGKTWHFRSKAADRRQGTGFAATSPARGPRWRRTPNHFRASGIEREVPGSGYLESEGSAGGYCAESVMTSLFAVLSKSVGLSGSCIRFFEPQVIDFNANPAGRFKGAAI